MFLLRNKYSILLSYSVPVLLARFCFSCVCVNLLSLSLSLPMLFANRRLLGIPIDNINVVLLND